MPTTTTPQVDLICNSSYRCSRKATYVNEQAAKNVGRIDLYCNVHRGAVLRSYRGLSIKDVLVPIETVPEIAERARAERVAALTEKAARDAERAAEAAVRHEARIAAMTAEDTVAFTVEETWEHTLGLDFDLYRQGKQREHRTWTIKPAESVGSTWSDATVEVEDDHDGCPPRLRIRNSSEMTHNQAEALARALELAVSALRTGQYERIVDLEPRA